MRTRRRNAVEKRRIASLVLSGLWGYGYGLSRQKHNYLPEAIGDSIFAVMAEELGMIRVSIIIILFVILAIRGLQIAMKAPDIFGKILAVGIVSTITVQVCINIAAITGLLPLTGIPLPFFSYGSTAMIVMLAEIGILLNISRQARA
jgi:cell division protein FtsW